MNATMLRWRRVQSGGLLAVSLSLFAVMLISAAVIPPVLIFALIYLGLAAAVWRFVEKSRVALGGAVLALVGILANIPFLVEDLAHLESWGSFVPSAVSVVAALSSAGAGFISLRTGLARAVRPYAYASVALAVALVLVSVVTSLAAENESATTGDVQLSAEDAEYPETLEASAGVVGFHIDNRDRIRHTFVIEEIDAKLELPAQKSRRIEVELNPGEYRFFCDVPGHEGMAGFLTVR